MVIKFQQKVEVETIFNVQNFVHKEALFAKHGGYKLKYFKMPLSRHMPLKCGNSLYKFQVYIINFGYSTILRTPKPQSVTNQQNEFLNIK